MEIEEVTEGFPILWYDEGVEDGVAELRCLTTRFICCARADQRRGSTYSIDGLAVKADGDALVFSGSDGSSVARWTCAKNPGFFFEKLMMMEQYKGLEGLI